VAHVSKDPTRSLDLLGRAAALALRLKGQAGQQGQVDVLRSKLQRARADLDAHRRRQPLDKRLVRRKADQVLALLIEYLTAVTAGSTEAA
jgi:hypothetical protein